MRKVIRALASSSVAGVVAAFVVVVVLVAGTRAQLNPFADPGPEATVDSTVAPDDTSGDDAGDDNRSVEERLADLEAEVASVNEVLDTVAEFNQKAGDALESIAGRLDTVESRVSKLSSDHKADRADIDAAVAGVASLRADVDSLGADVTELRTRTSKLSVDGNYSGPVEPGQLSRKLTPTDINGNWPLGRTTDKLDLDKVSPPFSGCSSDSRNYVVLTVDAFQRIQCLKVAK